MSSLIQFRNGRETPAPGRWTVAPGQPVSCAPGRWWHRQTRTWRTTAGGLWLDRSGPVSFRLSLQASRTLDSARIVQYQSFWIDNGTVDGHWQVSGEVIWSGQVIPARSMLTYHGVFRTGTGAVAWLGWHTRIVIDRTDAAPRRVRLSAELNLEAPAALLDVPVRFRAAGER